MSRSRKLPDTELTQAEKEAIWKVLHAEEEAIRRAVGDASVAWAGLESALCWIFITLGFFEQRDAHLPGVIFYSPSNFETRLSLIDDLMSYHFVVNALPQTHMPAIYALWPRLRNRISTKQAKRNAVAHGNLVSQNAGELRKRRVRLSPALLDTLRLHPARVAKQYYGMSSNDINQFTQSVIRLAGLLLEYNRILQAYQKGRKSTQGPILQDPELLEAVTRLGTKMSAHSQNSANQEQ